MEKALETIDGLAAMLTVEAAQDSAQLDLARERLKTVRHRVELHIEEVKKREEAKAKAIIEKEAELAKLKS